MSVLLFCGEPVKVVRLLDGNHASPEWDRAQRQYLENPLAFWLRPDGDYLSDTPYTPVVRHYDARCHWTIEMVPA